MPEPRSGILARRRSAAFFQVAIATLEARQPNSPTARQPNSPTARQIDSPTAQQPDRSTAQQPDSDFNHCLIAAVR